MDDIDELVKDAKQAVRAESPIVRAANAAVGQRAVLLQPPVNQVTAAPATPTPVSAGPSAGPIYVNASGDATLNQPIRNPNLGPNGSAEAQAYHATKAAEMGPRAPATIATEAATPVAAAAPVGNRLLMSTVPTGILAGGSAATIAAQGGVAANPEYFQKDIGDAGLAANIMTAPGSVGSLPAIPDFIKQGFSRYLEPFTGSNKATAASGAPSSPAPAPSTQPATTVPENPQQTDGPPGRPESASGPATTPKPSATTQSAVTPTKVASASKPRAAAPAPKTVAAEAASPDVAPQFDQAVGVLSGMNRYVELPGPASQFGYSTVSNLDFQAAIRAAQNPKIGPRLGMHTHGFTIDGVPVNAGILSGKPEDIDLYLANYAKAAVRSGDPLAASMAPELLRAETQKYVADQGLKGHQASAGATVQSATIHKEASKYTADKQSETEKGKLEAGTKGGTMEIPVPGAEPDPLTGKIPTVKVPVKIDENGNIMGDPAGVVRKMFSENKPKPTRDKAEAQARAAIKAGGSREAANEILRGYGYPELKN